ncbi:CCR4-NOT transcription complex subunit 1-like [Hibiscus syriacus]|uniref:CCR4-NOT transcription complex subunit 1-like n=1 Tax=Hibiscus syriacus TaxID=106335 RepID=UPI001922C7CC|nr:CCR4-NOT transcription complex subunit 1-like [Hibiscus syriacus]
MVQIFRFWRPLPIHFMLSSPLKFLPSSKICQLSFLENIASSKMKLAKHELVGHQYSACTFTIFEDVIISPSVSSYGRCLLCFYSFAWLELVSHRTFMPKLLSGNSQKGWPYIQRLLVDLLLFLEPFLSNAELGVPVHFLYKGTLRVLLVLLHDFPEFLCDYHFTFCDVIPTSCIQMRNIILSAFPRSMRLPDPSTPNLKIDLLPEIRESPPILSEVDAALKAKQMKADVDEYLKTKPQGGSSFLTELKQRLLLSPSEAASAGTRYNVPLMNSLVLDVGMQAIQQLQSRVPHAQGTENTVPLSVFHVSAALDIFQTLIGDLALSFS